jgi:hypothetical protein
MKKILAMAAIVMSLAACNDSGNGAETNADTSATMLGDTAGTGTGTGTGGMDTSTYNAGDSAGIMRDTSRTDRTGVRNNTDTGSRRRSDTLR